MSDQPLSPPTYAPVQAPAIEVPSQLRLHWAIMLILCCIVGKFVGLLGVSLWLLAQARWVRKVTGDSKAYSLSVASIVLFGATFVIGFLNGTTSAQIMTVGQWLSIGLACLMFIAVIVGLVLYLMAAFALRAELEAAPFGMKLSSVMTFFFSSVYFQYHLQKWGLPGELGGPPVVRAPIPPPRGVDNH